MIEIAAESQACSRSVPFPNFFHVLCDTDRKLKNSSETFKICSCEGLKRVREQIPIDGSRRNFSVTYVDVNVVAPLVQDDEKLVEIRHLGAL